MIVSLGMLAHNEAHGIGRTLASLFAQSVFHAEAARSGVTEWEIVVVPNGCTDATGEVAQRVLAETVSNLRGTAVRHSVRELVQSGKSNAWNHYIHEMSRQDADVIVMVDSDIEFGHVDTILNCLIELRSNTRAKVVVDLPLKDFLKKKRLSLIESISARSSAIQLSEDIGLSGQFYCAHARTLRQVWMPIGLSGEDGYLKGMIVTDLFRAPFDPARIARAENASHYYEGLSDLRSIFRHELRMVIGTSLNGYFLWDFLIFATDPTGPGASTLVRNWLAADPTWYRRTLENHIRNRGWFVVPKSMIFRRFEALRGQSWSIALRRIPIALIGFALDIPVFWLANKKLRSGKAFGFW